MFVMPHSGAALIDPQVIYEKIGLKPGMRVADLGCGRTGHFVFSSAKIVSDTGIVYAVDIMKDVLENIKSRSKSDGFLNIQTIWTDLERVGKTPIPENSLDACFFVNVMFQLKEKRDAIEESLRLLKKNGFLVIVDWTKKIGTLGPSDDLMTDPNILKKTAEQAGAESKGLGQAGDYHYYLILQKT